MIEKLYSLFYKEILGWCMAMSKGKYMAEDLVQETFFKALQHADTLEDMGEKQCRAWLYKTARNLYVDKVRHSSFEISSDILPETPGEDGALTDFENAQLLSLLPSGEQTIFVLRYMEGYNSTEISEMLSIPAATVRTRLASAKKRLRKALQ